MGKFIKSLAMGMVVLVLAVNMGNGLTKEPLTVKTQAEPSATAQQHAVTSQLPQPGQAKAVFHGQWMTEAAMTSHNLTAAHFLGRSATKKLSTETQDLSKRG
jgi:hypothetical protein